MNKENTSCDTSTLINFLKIQRLDLLKKSHLFFLITDHVQNEVLDVYPEQYTALESAMAQNILKKKNVETQSEWTIFADLVKTKQLGAGECAAIAVASSNGYHLAIDDIRAIKKAVPLMIGGTIITTLDLIMRLIQQKDLSIEEADELAENWKSKHRFNININSFRDVIPAAI